MNCNEIFQLALSFAFTWTFSSLPALSCAWPAACRVPCDGAEELLVIGVPYMPTADAMEDCSFPLEMPVAFARQPTL